jgi:hypothetical protein
MTKYEIDLSIPMTYQYVKFGLNVYKLVDNKQKLKISYFSMVKGVYLFQKSTRHDQIQTSPELSLNVSVRKVSFEFVKLFGR